MVTQWGRVMSYLKLHLPDLQEARSACMIETANSALANPLATGGTSLPTAIDCWQAPRLSLGANDGPVDDFLEVIDNWERVTGHKLVPGNAAPVIDHAESGIGGQIADAAGGDAAQNVLDRIASDFSAHQMRILGASLLKLADAIDQDWHPARFKSRFGWMTRSGQIERRALTLAQVAIRLRAKAKQRTKHLSQEFLGEPAWEMLLELFIQFAGGATVSTKSLCLASGLADTSALRMIDRLEDAGLLERSQSSVDKRITLVGLSKQGVTAVGMILMDADC